MKKLWERYGFREISGSAPPNREVARIKEKNLCKLWIINDLYGGGRGIRTPGTLSGTTVFKTAGINRSPIPPHLLYT